MTLLPDRKHLSQCAPACPSLLLLNARSLSPDIICVTESWFNDSIESSLINISNYNVARSDRSYRRGGGVAVYLRQNISFVIVPEIFELSTNADFLALDVQSMSILLVCVYIPPSLSADTLQSIHAHLVNTIDTFLLGKPFYNVIVVGDMNQFDVHGVCSDLDMLDLIVKPTRQGNVLDHILISSSFAKNYDPKDVLYDAPICSSDHKTIFCRPKWVGSVSSPVVRWHKLFDFRQSNLDFLFYEASMIDWSDLLPQDGDVDDLWRILHTKLSDLLQRCIPTRLVPITDNDKKWMTPITKALIIDRSNAFRTGNWALYAHLKNKVKVEIQKAKKLWANKLMSTSNGLWTLVSKHQKKQNGDISSLIPSFGTEETLLQFLADHLSAHFSSSSNPPNLENFHENFRVWNPSISEYQVLKALKRYPTKKAQGLDEIPTRIYVELAFLIANPLTFIFNQSLKQRKFPQSWKVGRMVAIPKTNPPRTDKLRFLTLLPVPSKIFEKLVLTELRGVFDRAYGNDQHGFRPRASTTTALLRIADVATRFHDDKANFGVAILSYDLSSAFDTIDHSLALKKLEDMEFPDGFLTWLASYLTDRTAVLKTSTLTSDPVKILRGVPQGSVLGPSIFCSYIRDFSVASEEATVVKYADDITIVLPIQSNSPVSIRSSINNETQNVSQWCAENHLLLNTTKSKCLLATKQKVENIEGLTIDSVSTLRLLGLHFNTKLNWDTHVEFLRVTCCRRLHILRRLRGLIPSSHLLLVYHAIVRSVLEYSSPVFVGLNKKNSTIIKKIENRAKRIITFGSSEPLITENEKDSLQGRRLGLSKRLWDAIDKNEDHLLHHMIPKRLPFTKKYNIIYHRTDKFANSFFLFMARYLNSSS